MTKLIRGALLLFWNSIRRVVSDLDAEDSKLTGRKRGDGEIKSRWQWRYMLLTICASSVGILTYLYSEKIADVSRRFYIHYSENMSANPAAEKFPLRPPCSSSNVTGYVIDASYPCSFCNGRNASDGKWFNFSTNSFEFFAYTAFYDDRPSLSSDPVIRIIAVSTSMSGRKDTGLFCLIYHLSGTVWVSIESAPKAFGTKVGLQPYIYTCPVPSVDIRPLALSIQAGPQQLAVRSCMPVEYPAKRKVPMDFAVCVPVSFGYIDPYHLIEWTEMQRILGVGVVGIYDLSIDPAGRNVSRYYANEGFFDYRKTDQIFPGKQHNILQSSAVLNDCYYRHMYDVKWVIVNDVDEFIKPMKHKDLKELVTYLERTISNASSTLSTNFIIRNNYFLLEHPPDTNISSHLVFLRYRKRSPVSGTWDRMKPIIHTMACTNVWNHKCMGMTKKYSKRNLLESIDPEIALTQHYRFCPWSPLQCAKLFNDSKLDDSILIFQDILKRNVQKKIQEIMGRLPSNWV